MMKPSRPVVPEPEPREQSPESVHSKGYSASPSPAPAPQTNHIWIDVLSPSAGASAEMMFSPPASYLSRSAAALNAVEDFDFRTLGPRLLRNIDPTVTFTSPTPVACYSSFIVTKHDQIWATDVTPVEECQPAASGSAAPAFMYRTSLVPKLWAQLCESEGEWGTGGRAPLGPWSDSLHAEPESFTINQEIVLASDGAPPLAGSSHHQQHANTVLSSVQYHFNNAATASRALSPNPSIDGSVSSHSALSSAAIRTVSSFFEPPAQRARRADVRCVLPARLGP